MSGGTSFASLANMPAGPPPTGVAPNFEHPASRANEIYVGLGICLAISAAFLLLRFWIKLELKRSLNTEDFAVVTSFLLILAHDITSFILVQPGGILGFHIWDIRVTSINKSSLEKSLLTLNFYAASAFFAKLALFVLYLRIFGPNKITRFLVYAGVAVCAAFYASSIIANCVLFMPKPGQPNTTQYWLARQSGAGRRSKSALLAVVQAVFGSLSDIYLLVIPIYSISKLQLPLQRKVGVCTTFLIGLIAIACSLGSLALRAKNLDSKDETWNGVPIYILSQAEIAAGLICNCTLLFPSYFHGRLKMKIAFDFKSFAQYFSWKSSTSANTSERSGRQTGGNKSYEIEMVKHEASKYQPSRSYDGVIHHGSWVKLNGMESDEEQAIR